MLEIERKGEIDMLEREEGGERGRGRERLREGGGR